jgi:hypothetical protein
VRGASSALRAQSLGPRKGLAGRVSCIAASPHVPGASAARSGPRALAYGAGLKPQRLKLIP